MKLPCMVIIFNKEMSDKLPCGIKCAFSAHASMWLSANLLNDRVYDGIDIVNKSDNKYGHFSCLYEHDNLFDEWLNSDYRKLVMSSPKTIGNLFEVFEKAQVPFYLQKTSHNIRVVDSNFGLHDQSHADLRDPGINKITIETGTPICLVIFLWKDEHKKLLEDMELI